MGRITPDIIEQWSDDLLVPEGEVGDSPEAAWDTAQDIGLPVVVKPLDGNHGRGVSINLQDEDAVAAARAVAPITAERPGEGAVLRGSGRGKARHRGRRPVWSLL